MTCDRCRQPIENPDDHGVWKCPLEMTRHAAAVRADTIPGGRVIYHGLCHPDGTPRTYYSESEIDRECAARGLTRWTDIHSEDKTKDARVRADWLKSDEAKRQRRDREEARRAGDRR